MNIENKEYEASLKSIETENIVDKAFYRPIGFKLAKFFSTTNVTPNQITVISIFVGAVAGFMFYHADIYYSIAGILFLVAANILDCVDGQLARLTGIKSKIGRILDGFAGDIWFLSIYIGFAMRLNSAYDTSWFFLLALLSGLSHLVQANITDYYKTLHLFFISKEKGKEFQSLDQIKSSYEKMDSGIEKFFYFFYQGYTKIQIYFTPRLQQMLGSIQKEYGEEIPDSVRISFRKKSKSIMKYIDLLTFNGRTLAMFLIVLIGEVWVYYLFEIIILNSVLVYAMHRHEKMCASFIKK